MDQGDDDIKIFELPLPGVKMICPEVYKDSRGWSMESYSAKTFQQAGINDAFVLRYESFNKLAGTIRGIHFQDGPAAHSKLVQCSKGALWDVMVDLRKSEPTFGQWISAELSEENGSMLYLPIGVGHGFATLSDDTHVVYLISQLYDPDHAKCIAWNDTTLNIMWPVGNPVLSDKDRYAPKLDQCVIEF